MAISKEKKAELIEHYKDLVVRSQAIFLTEYRGLTMSELEELRRKIREAGGEFHVVKNTLSKLAFEAEGLPMSEGHFEGPTAIGFVFQDAPSIAKIMANFAKGNELLKIKINV